MSLSDRMEAERTALYFSAVMELAEQAKNHLGLPKDTRVRLEAVTGDWSVGGDDLGMGQVLYPKLVFRNNLFTRELAGHMCITTWPGTKDPPLVTGRFEDWNFRFNI